MSFSIEPLNIDGSPGSHLKVTDERFINIVPATFSKDDVELQARIKRPSGGTFRLYIRYGDLDNNYFLEFGDSGIIVRKRHLGVDHVLSEDGEMPDDSLGLVWRFRCKSFDNPPYARFDVAVASLDDPTNFAQEVIYTADHCGPVMTAASMLTDLGLITKFALEFEGTDMEVDKVFFYELSP